MALQSSSINAPVLLRPRPRTRRVCSQEKLHLAGRTYPIAFDFVIVEVEPTPTCLTNVWKSGCGGHRFTHPRIFVELSSYWTTCRVEEYWFLQIGSHHHRQAKADNRASLFVLPPCRAPAAASISSVEFIFGSLRLERCLSISLSVKKVTATTFIVLIPTLVVFTAPKIYPHVKCHLFWESPFLDLIVLLAGLDFIQQNCVVCFVYSLINHR